MCWCTPNKRTPWCDSCPKLGPFYPGKTLEDAPKVVTLPFHPKPKVVPGEITEIEYGKIVSLLGWKCPECGACFAPTVEACRTCTGDAKK